MAMISIKGREYVDNTGSGDQEYLVKESNKWAHNVGRKEVGIKPKIN